MMPVIKAQESLERSLEIAVGTGSMKRHHVRSTLRDWRRVSQTFAKKSKPYRPATKEQHHALLAQIGVKVQE